jgi:hypothetical protein
VRTKLALAGLVAGLAALAPVAPASAQCDPQIGTETGSGCSNGCTETGNAIDKVLTAVDDRVAAADLPGYWDVFACTQ